MNITQDQNTQPTTVHIAGLFKNKDKSALTGAHGLIGQVLFLLEKWWREAGFGLAEVCLAKSVFS